MNWSNISTLVLGVGGLITAIIALLSARSAKNKTNSETSLNIATVEQSRENLYQSRELFLREEVEKIRETLQTEIAKLRSEVTSLRMLIESHVPWDWEVVRQLKLAGIDFRDPPTLNYLNQQPEET